MKVKKYMMITFGIAFALLILTAGTVVADNNYFEGPVYNGTDLHDIIGNDSEFIEMNATNFEGFFYDSDDNIYTEILRVFGGANISGRTIEKNGLTYRTNIQELGFESNAFKGTYNIMRFLGDVYVPLKSGTPDKLAKLLTDCNEEYRLPTGETLEFGNGYELTSKGIDIEGEKVWMELSRNGTVVDDEVVDILDNRTWNLEQDIKDENDVPVFKIHVSDIIENENLVVIDGFWLVDFKDVYTIDPGNKFGVLEVDMISSEGIVLSNGDSITLTRDSMQEIGGGLKFKVTDSDDLVFNLIKERTDSPNLCPKMEIVYNSYDFNHDCRIEIDELNEAIDDYRLSLGTIIAEVNTLIDIYRIAKPYC